MAIVTWILGILFMVISLLFGVSFAYASSVTGFGVMDMFGNNIFSVIIVLVFSVIMPFLPGLFFMLLPSYVRKHAATINTGAFD